MERKKPWSKYKFDFKKKRANLRIYIFKSTKIPEIKLRLLKERLHSESTNKGHKNAKMKISIRLISYIQRNVKKKLLQSMNSKHLWITDQRNHTRTILYNKMQTMYLYI